jgi:hypothetical protein
MALPGPIYDPSQVPPAEPPFPTNPLQLLTDAQLEGWQISLYLACGRSKTELRKKHRQFTCLGLYVLGVEKARRDALKA